ncbi:hypothetical protein Plhal710r2_c028g0107341 [Plasmopara halstedii]
MDSTNTQSKLQVYSRGEAFWCRFISYDPHRNAFVVRVDQLLCREHPLKYGQLIMVDVGCCEVEIFIILQYTQSHTMNVQYIDSQEPQPIQIDDDYYSLPTHTPKSEVAESRITLDDYHR